MKNFFYNSVRKNNFVRQTYYFQLKSVCILFRDMFDVYVDATIKHIFRRYYIKSQKYTY